MSVLESKTIDMSQVLTQAYELGDLINDSAEVFAYQYWKNRLEQDREAQELIRAFTRKKELFEECERFGHYHPDYHAAQAQAKEMQERMGQNESIRSFKQAEDQLDDLLYRVARTLADAVSDTILVPANKLIEDDDGCSSGSCGSGGSCNGGCA